MVTEVKESKLTGEQQLNRFLHCVSDVFEYFKYVKIRDETTQRIVPFEMWSHLRLLLTYLLIPGIQLSLFKSKQIGASWTLAGFHDWKSYRPATRILCLSKGREESAELLGKSKFINDNMPDWLRLRYGYEGREYISFKDTGAQILALPSTEDAGVGYTATHVTRDELEFHDFAEANYGHIKPTVDAGASICDMSTSKRSKPLSHMKTQFKRARAGENNYVPMFFPYYVRPGRDRNWYLRTRRDYWPLWLFEQDYPRNLEDCLGSVEGEGLFDKSSIERMLNEVREPTEVWAGNISIYHRPDPKVHYYAGGDAAEGRGGDNGVIWIEGRKGFDRELCAIMCTNQLTPDTFAYHAHNLLVNYGRPLLVMGGDAWGQMVLGNLAALGYRDRIHCSEENDKEDKKLGLIENESNKQQKLMNFSFAVRDGLGVRYRQAIDEMSGWIIENGKYVSTYPTDDCIIAGANATIARELDPVDEYVDVDHFY